MSIVAAEYSKDPVNMNRKQWEKEQSWGDFIAGDMQYCRNKAECFEGFIFLMEKLGYEVKTGAHISAKAEGMRRSRRLDILDEDFSVQKLHSFYEQERPYKYVDPPVYNPGYALRKKPSNAFQQRYYEKLYHMCVVQKCRFQYKYTRYQQDLIRMKELQEEYLFLNREGINGWEDVFRAKQLAEQKIADIDAKKKELYNEHEAYADLQNFATPDMAKEHYEALTDKEKVEWLGIAECRVQDVIQRFISKLDFIGVVYQHSDDMLDEFMRLEFVVAQMKRERETQKRNRARR